MNVGGYERGKLPSISVCNTSRDSFFVRVQNASRMLYDDDDDDLFLDLEMREDFCEVKGELPDGRSDVIKEKLSVGREPDSRRPRTSRYHHYHPSSPSRKIRELLSTKYRAKYRN